MHFLRTRGCIASILYGHSCVATRGRDSWSALNAKNNYTLLQTAASGQMVLIWPALVTDKWLAWKIMLKWLPNSFRNINSLGAVFSWFWSKSMLIYIIAQAQMTFHVSSIHCISSVKSVSWPWCITVRPCDALAVSWIKKSRHSGGLDKGPQLLRPLQSSRQDKRRLNCTKFGKLIRRKIIKIVATRSHI